MTRTRLCDRALPVYSVGEELMNAVTHGVGALLAVAAAVICILTAARHGNRYGIVGSAVYGASMIALYTVSSVYHGLPKGMGKKVMQVVDHCTIYSLIAGTYTVMALSAIRPLYPRIGWGLFFFEWGMAVIATVLTAIDLKKYNVCSMICYIGLGWAILPFLRQTVEAATRPGFLLLLWGGIAYTVGAVLYGLGTRKKWMHSVFHIFVLIGSTLQFFAVVFYAV